MSPYTAFSLITFLPEETPLRRGRGKENMNHVGLT